MQTACSKAVCGYFRDSGYLVAFRARVSVKLASQNDGPFGAPTILARLKVFAVLLLRPQTPSLFFQFEAPSLVVGPPEPSLAGVSAYSVEILATLWISARVLVSSSLRKLMGPMKGPSARLASQMSF